MGLDREERKAVEAREKIMTTLMKREYEILWYACVSVRAVQVDVE